MKKKALIFRASPAFGDTIFISSVPRQLKERGYEHVTIVLWEMTKFIFDNNPYVDEFITIDNFKDESFEDQKDEWEKEYDIFDLRYTVEYNYFDKSHTPEFTIDKRRERAKGKNYYKDGLGAYDLSAEKGELYLNDYEKTIVAKYKNQGRKRILWQAAGSGRNKILTYIGSFINDLAKKNPDIEHWIVGKLRSSLSNLDANVFDKRDEWSDPRKTLSMIPMFDLVIGPESFAVNVSGAFDVPTMVFYSHSHPDNLGKYFKHHYPVVPTCDCHPCYLLVSDFRSILDLKHRELARQQELYCLLRDRDNIHKGITFRCCHFIEYEKILNQILEIVKG